MRNCRSSAMWTVALVCMLGASGLAQTDPGVRGGQQNTAGYLQYRGIQNSASAGDQPESDDDRDDHNQRAHIIQPRHLSRREIGCDLRDLLQRTRWFSGYWHGRT